LVTSQSCRKGPELRQEAYKRKKRVVQVNVSNPTYQMGGPDQSTLHTCMGTSR
jgi:hypothetical protein